MTNDRNIFKYEICDKTEYVKRVIWRDGEYTNNILRRNKFIMTA